jgi:5'-nucleotidase
VFGIPAVALSYAGRGDVEHLDAYGPLLGRLLAQMLAQDGFPRETLLNVNLPPIPPEQVKGVMVTRLGRRVFSDSYVRGTDPSGRPYFWIGGGSIEWAAEEGTDFFAVDNGYISVTPLHLDLTNHALIEGVSGWSLSV